MGVAMCPFLIWPSHFLGASYVPEPQAVMSSTIALDCRE